MADTRLIVGTILRPNGAPWKGGEVRIQPLDDTFTVSPDDTYPIDVISAVADDNGDISVTLAAGLSVAYRVMLPDRSTFDLIVPPGDPTTLELLRAAYSGFPPDAPPDLESAIEAMLGDPAIQGLIDHNQIDNRGVQNHSAIDAHIGATTAHGATGAVVGTTGAQTLADKTLGTGTKVAVGSDAAGDVWYRAADGTLTRVAIGTAGHALKVNAGATAPEWGEVSGGASALDDLTDVTLTAPASGDVVKYNGSIWVNAPDAGGSGGGSGAGDLTGSLVFQLGDLAGGVLTTGTKAYLRVPFACTLTGWSLAAGVSTTTTLDVAKDTTVNYPPTFDADRIAGTEKPTLSAATNASDSALSTWTTAVAAGDWIAVEIEANDNAKYLVLSLDYTRTFVSQMTTEDVQDIIGALAIDSATIDFTYDDAFPSLIAEVIFGTTAGTVAEGDHLHAGVYAEVAHTQAASTITDFAEAVDDRVGALIVDSASIDATYDDGAGTLSLAAIANSSVQQIEVADAGTLVGTRARINFIDGSGISTSVADDAGNDRVNITITNTGDGGGGGGSVIVENGDSVIGTATTIDFTQAGFVAADQGAGEIGIAPNFGSGAGNVAEGNHTHASTGITDFTEAAQDAVGAILVDSSSINFTYTDATPEITAAAIFGTTAGTVAEGNHTHIAEHITDFAENVDDRVAALIIASDGATKVYNDTTGTLTLAADFGGTGAATTVSRSDHTQAAATITDFAEAVDDRVAALILPGTGITEDYNDASNSLTLAADIGTGGTQVAAGNHGHTLTGAVKFVLGDLAGAVLATGTKGYISIPFACTLTGWRLLADASGSLVMDVWKDTYANYPPTDADRIAGTEKPTLSTAISAEDTALSTWTTAVAAGDVLGVEIESATTVKWAELTLMYTRTI